ncbi:Mal D 1-associated protein [Senna tora]|uniref:Mal D 1-associated protein n=1 Tax=Senna tora TaxID=362788 RepID=A0A834SNT3_9FABA|nr:Mal D 1-associated protein [Senna tora]
MGWVWRDDDDDQLHTSSRGNTEFGEPCSTTKVVKSQCRTEEVEPGKFVRKCEKTHEFLKECIGKPVEVVQSNKVYTEEDVTQEVLKGGSSSSRFGSPDANVFDFPGLRRDLEAMEKNIINGVTQFFEAAEDMKNGFFDVVAKAQRIFDGEASASSSSPSMRRGIPIDEHPRREASPKPNESEAIDADLSALAKDV